MTKGGQPYLRYSGGDVIASLPRGFPELRGMEARVMGRGMELAGDEDTLLVFMDECGDHSAGKADPDFPLLLLAFVLVERKRYAAEVIPAVRPPEAGFLAT